MSVTQENINLAEALPALIARYEGRLPVVEAICTGKLPLEQLREIAARLYADGKAAIQVKFPERLRICPMEAVEARRYWYQQLAEESGDFEPGQDHGSLLAPTCLAIGLTTNELDDEYQRHLSRVDYLHKSPISMELTLREATQLYVDEAIFVNQANRIGDALREHYGVPEDALRYFRLHAVLDVGHSAAGLDMLVATAQTEAQQRFVLETAETALEQFPIWAVDIHSASP
jgi:pyrroloquinoline quinone (PQQ) biosynthesis protein C